jgi:hypothetical protein
MRPSQTQTRSDQQASSPTPRGCTGPSLSPPSAAWGSPRSTRSCTSNGPPLYPVLDGRLRTVYAPQAGHWVDRLFPDTQRGDSETFWAAIRDDLVDPGNRAALKEYRDLLRTDSKLTKIALLTDLRLLDIVAWRTAGATATRARHARKWGRT